MAQLLHFGQLEVLYGMGEMCSRKKFFFFNFLLAHNLKLLVLGSQPTFFSCHLYCHYSVCIAMSCTKCSDIPVLFHPLAILLVPNILSSSFSSCSAGLLCPGMPPVTLLPPCVQPAKRLQHLK